jgi:hypothetical protein
MALRSNEMADVSAGNGTTFQLHLKRDGVCTTAPQSGLCRNLCSYSDAPYVSRQNAGRTGNMKRYGTKWTWDNRLEEV